MLSSNVIPSALPLLPGMWGLGFAWLSAPSAAGVSFLLWRASLSLIKSVINKKKNHDIAHSDELLHGFTKRMILSAPQLCPNSDKLHS